MHTPEHYAESVAVEVLGPRPVEGGKAALPWDQIIQMAMQIFTALLASCPAKDTQKLAAIKTPGLRGRGKFDALVYQSCQCCAPTSVMRRNSAAISSAMQSEAAKMDDGDILGIIFAIQNDGWEVI